jgi:hypothetical protein
MVTGAGRTLTVVSGHITGFYTPVEYRRMPAIPPKAS